MLTTDVKAILVPLDGSEFAEAALPVAARLAAGLAAEVHLFSAVPSPDKIARREELLSAIAIPASEVHRFVVVSTDAAGAIHQALGRLDHAVVCMASHGRGRSAAFLGSVAAKIVARGHDPLIIVGPEVSGELNGEGVIACVDDTPASAALLPVARRWAELLDEQLVVITVAEPVPEPVPSLPMHRRFGPDDADAFLRDLVMPVVATGFAVETRTVYDPISPADGVRSLLHDRPASLVVVSSHARGGVARVALGSVAAGIVRVSSSPVLVVPRPEVP